MAYTVCAANDGIDLNQPVYLAFVTGPPAATPQFLDAVAEANSDATLLVVARQRPGRGEWIQVRDGEGILAACRRAIAGREIRGVAVHATRRSGEWRMRIAALRIAGRLLVIYNDSLDSFALRNTNTLWRHLKWRWRQRARKVLWWNFLADLALWCALDHRFPLANGRPRRRFAPSELQPGISLVIPTRDGRDLLASMLEPVIGDLEQHTAEVIVVDNGSSDGTAEFLSSRYPAIRIQTSPAPLSFAEAVNRGISAARYSHVVLLNNDMQIEPGFFTALRAAFDGAQDLFCATAQIFFPEGQRREETGLCFWHRNAGDDFPVYCAEPVLGQDGTLVLYGSGGCSMYDTAKLRDLGGFDESYQPAYVEDLDIGYRAWLKGWPTVFCAAARVEHRHRATTSRYYSPEYLDYLVERHYLRFLVRATGGIFPELWRDAIARLKHRATDRDRAAQRVLRMAWREALARRANAADSDERALKEKLTQ